MTSPDLYIATVGAEASQALARLHAAAFDRPWSAADLAEVLASPFAFALQAGSPPTGFILARAVAGEAEILTLAVDPHARRQGAGSALVLAARSVARSAGAQALWLEVAADNVAAIGLYAAAGFEAVGRRPAYYPRPSGAIDALSLRCRLNSGLA